MVSNLSGLQARSVCGVEICIGGRIFVHIALTRVAVTTRRGQGVHDVVDISTDGNMGWINDLNQN